MKKILRFTHFSVRDFLATSVPVVLLLAGLCALAYVIIDPAPPREVILATGQENSAYDEFGKQYAAALARDGIKVVQQRSLGSAQNLQLLREGKVDIAFVQSGSTEQAVAGRRGLVSLGSLFIEPVWLFLRAESKATQLSDLRGLRINVGPDGTGVPQLFKQLLDANGMEMNELVPSKLEDSYATKALVEGDIDGLVFSSAPESLLIQMLLQTPGIVLFDFPQAEAYTRRLPFLTQVLLPRGIVDLGRNLPPQDYHLIAPTATLVARVKTHPALLQLFVQAAATIHGGTGWFQQHAQFPSPRFTEIPVAREAAKFYKDGPPLLERYMNFWMANLLDRMWVFVVAGGALLIPLSRVVPPLYVWRIRSRVYRWYGQLRAVEQELDQVAPAQRQAVCQALLERLDHIEARVNHLSVPLSFADAWYGLRSHIKFVRERVHGAMEETKT
ncbi:MAG: TAXI family TRAP transporter solute-binding subunit [Pseudomonadota bacterium]